MSNILETFFKAFTSPTNYGEMLKKLSSIAFYEVYFIILILRGFPEIDDAFKSIESFGVLKHLIENFPLLGKINAAGFLIAILVALISHISNLHDKISDLIGIRELFDCKHIAFPLARLVGAPLTRDQRAEFRADRDHLMRIIFYRYASSRAENPVVDKHDIQHALSNWTWFWVCVEGAFYFAVTALLLTFAGPFQVGGCFYLASVALILLGWAQYSRLPGYARAQFEQIADNPQAALEIRAAFNAL